MPENYRQEGYQNLIRTGPISESLMQQSAEDFKRFKSLIEAMDIWRRDSLRHAENIYLD